MLFHLTQLTSAALNPRRPCSPLVSGTISSRPHQGTAPQNEGDFDIMCSHSLNTVSIIAGYSCDYIIRFLACDLWCWYLYLFCFQALNNCSELILKHLPKIKVGFADKLASWLFWNQLTNRPLQKTKLTLPWRVTYTSSESFFENKNGFPQQQLTYSSFPTVISFSDTFTRRLLHSMHVRQPFSFGKLLYYFYLLINTQIRLLTPLTFFSPLVSTLWDKVTILASASFH